MSVGGELLHLRKHVSVHSTDKYCHYFNNHKDCLFEELGCKFRHEDLSVYKFNRSCENLLCQFNPTSHGVKEDPQRHGGGTIITMG